MPGPTPKNYLITGGGRGIGRGLARLLVARNNRVFLLDNNKDELDNTIRRILQSTSDLSARSIGGTQCNLRDPRQIQEAVKEAEYFFGGHLDVLVNNAANTSVAVGHTTFEMLSLDEWNASLETNLTAPFLVSQACLAMLRETRGSIIHMSSTRAIQSEPNCEAYASSKAGLIGLTHAMATSLGPMGIRINAILPGWISVADESEDADHNGQGWEAAGALSTADHEWHLAGRVGKVEDVLQAVEYLATADFITGTEHVVDGGVTRKMVYPE